MTQVKNAIRRGLRRARLDVQRLPELMEPSRRDGRLGLFETALGPLWLPLDAPDDIVVRDIRRGLVFESEIVRLLARYIVPGTTVIDAGANFGQMAIAFSHAVGSAGEVHALEANAALADLCRRNVAECARPNVVVHGKAAWNESGATLTFPESDRGRFGSSGGHPVDPSGSRGQKVETLALDDLPLRSRVSAIKIGIQGSDLRALQGARRLVARDRPAIVFEFEQQSRGAGCPRRELQEELGTTLQDYVDLVRSYDYVFASVHLGLNYLILPRESRESRESREPREPRAPVRQ